MSVLDRLFKRGSKQETSGAPSAHAPAVECLHIALTPRWDRIEDMGHEDRATSFLCDACQMTLTPAEASEARAKVGERLHLE